MNAAQIVVRTVVTTVDLLLMVAFIKTIGVNEKATKAVTVGILLNLLGVWI